MIKKGTEIGQVKLNYFLDNSFLLKPLLDAQEIKQRNQALQLDFMSTPIEAVPNLEDFFVYPFRQLSADSIIGRGSWKATKFPNEILRGAMMKLEGIPAMIHHSRDKSNEIGTIGVPSWQDVSYSETGKQIPAGINAPFIIDSKRSDIATKICRSLNSPNPPRTSCSVSAVFNFKTDNDYPNVRAFDEALQKGEAHRVVTKIVKFLESSIVFNGADEFAKNLNENGLVNVGYSADDTEQWTDYINDKKYYIFDEMPEKINLSFSSVSDNDKSDNSMGKIKLVGVLATAFGMSEGAEITSEQFEQKSAELVDFEVVKKSEMTDLRSKANRAELAQKDRESAVLQFAEEKEKTGRLEGQNKALQTDFDNLQKEKIDLEAQNLTLQKQIDFASPVIEKYRSDVRKGYLLKAGDEQDEKILKDIEEGSFSDLEKISKLAGIETSFSAFGAKCKACGGSELEFGTAQKPEPEEDTTGEEIVGIYQFDNI